jgi:hypothetical protein
MIPATTTLLTFPLKELSSHTDKEYWDIAQHDSSFLSQKGNKILDKKPVIDYDINVHF